MFGKKKHPEEIENLIRKKINNKDTDFPFHIKEVKVKIFTHVSVIFN